MKSRRKEAPQLQSYRNTEAIMTFGVQKLQSGFYFPDFLKGVWEVLGILVVLFAVASCGGGGGGGGNTTPPSCPNGQHWNGSACVPDVTGDTTPPTVTIVTPSNNTVVSGTVVLRATASDPAGIGSVQFFVNDNPYCDGDVTPSAGALSTDTRDYECVWNPPPGASGSYKIKAVACDNAGNENSNTVTVTVANSNLTLVAPTNLVIVEVPSQITWSDRRAIKATWVNNCVGDNAAKYALWSTPFVGPINLSDNHRTVEFFLDDLYPGARTKISVSCAFNPGTGPWTVGPAAYSSEIVLSP